MYLICLLRHGFKLLKILQSIVHVALKISITENKDGKHLLCYDPEYIRNTYTSAVISLELISFSKDMGV